MYTGYRLCEGIIKGTDDASKGFLAAGGIFIVIGAVLLIKAVRNLAKAAQRKHRAGSSSKKNDRGKCQEENVYLRESASGRESG